MLQMNFSHAKMVHNTAYKMFITYSHFDKFMDTWHACKHVCVCLCTYPSPYMCMRARTHKITFLLHSL
jgi:hypothetical protein